MKCLSYIKKNGLYLLCKFALTPPSFSKIPEDIDIVECDNEEITLLSETSNNIMRIKKQDEEFYFRECRLHEEIHKYVWKLIEEYYDYLQPMDKSYEEKVKMYLSKKSNFRNFINMGTTNDKTSRVYKFLTGFDGKIIGLPFTDKEDRPKIEKFVQFMWGELYAYKLNGGLRKNYYQTYNATREIATYIMSLQIGLDSLIPETKYIVLKIPNREPKLGTLMARAPGVCMKFASAEERKSVLSPKFQHDLCNLNLLDILCYERDHKPSNYNVLIEDGKIVSVCAFDNDSPMSFSFGKASFCTYMHCAPMISTECKISRPFIDGLIANKIMEIDIKGVKKQLGKTLNKYQIRMLVHRIKTVQNAISKSNCFLYSESDWNDDTLNRELEYTDGLTYLQLFASDFKLPTQPWITTNNPDSYYR